MEIPRFSRQNIYCNLTLSSKKMCKNKKCAKHDKLYIFETLLPRQIQICKNIWKNLKNKIFIEGQLQILKENCKYWRRTANVQHLFKGIFAKICRKILRNNCAICFLLFKAFHWAIKSRNPMTESRSKYRFSRVKVK